jgi:energy-converting hydrogenase Eha subunit A
MVTVRVLKRKDAASVVVAVALGLALFSSLQPMMSDLAYRLASMGSDTPYRSSANLRDGYLTPLLTLLLTVLAIEVLLIVVTMVRPLFVRKRR